MWSLSFIGAYIKIVELHKCKLKQRCYNVHEYIMNDCVYASFFWFVCVFVFVYLSVLGSSGDSEDCAIGSHGLRVPTQKSYSSSETLKAFDQHQDQTRLELTLHTVYAFQTSG